MTVEKAATSPSIDESATRSELWYDGQTRDLKMLPKADHLHVTTLERTVLGIMIDLKPNDVVPKYRR